MHSKSIIRRALATLSALALIINLAPGIITVPITHAADNEWTETYWNVAMDGPFVFPEAESDYSGTIPDQLPPQYFLGDTSPHVGLVNPDNFVARYEADLTLDAGEYTFRTYTDDGVRLYIDSELVIDQWVDQGNVMYTYTMAPGAGSHNVVMEYYEHGGNSTIYMDYHKTSDFGNGNSRPYVISTCQELQAIGGNLSANYILGNNINCLGIGSWNEYFGTGRGFTPIGNTAYRFTGEFDGDGRTISNLLIDDTNLSYVGLFGVIDEGASVHDLDLEDVDITGYNEVGALAGGLSGTVTNVTSSGIVNGNSDVGGLVGIHVEPGGIGSSSPLVYTWNGDEYKYIADVGRGIPRNVVGNDDTPVSNADLVPKDGAYSVKISEEYNEIVYYDELSLTTIDHAPGYEVATSFARSAREGFTTIAETPSNPLQSCVDQYGNDCKTDLESFDDKWSYKDDSNLNYWTMDFGDLSAAERIQLVVRGARNFSIKNGTTVKYIQVKDAHGAWVNAYTSAQLSTLGGTPLNRAIDMTGKFPTSDYSVRVAFDRSRINYFAIDTSAPVEYTVNTVHPTSVNLGFHGYSAIDKTYYWNHDYETTSNTPPEIFATQNGNFTKYGDVTPLLESTDDQFVVIHHGDEMDINFDYTAPAEGMERSFLIYNWATFKHADMGDAGRTVDPLPFNGMSKYPYDAPEAYPMTPSNVDYLNTWNTRVVNDHAVDHSSTIINSSSSVDVEANNTVGGLVGYNAKLITGSFANGVVNGQNSSVGGLVGYNDTAGTIVYSYANCLVGSPSWYVGGLAGMNYGTIEKSYAYSATVGFNNVGGLVGYNSGTMNDVYATGNVEADENAGGLVGFSNGTLTTNAYAAVVVGNAGEFIGGLSPNGDGSGFVNSFWDVDFSGVETTNGEGQGLATEDMKTQATFTEAGWNFNTIWAIDAEQNDGYPTLQPAPVPETNTRNHQAPSQGGGNGIEGQDDGNTDSSNHGGGGSSGSNDANDSPTNTPNVPTEQPTESHSEHIDPNAEHHHDDVLGHEKAVDSDKTAPSPWTAMQEPVSGVAAGWYIRGEHYDTVYLVTADGQRRPFWDAKTFMTYTSDWNQVIWVTDATLSTLKPGEPMLPKAGVTLVKIQGEASVYATTSEGDTITLHRVPDEATAIAVFGPDWADYVIDLEPTIFYHYAAGPDLKASDVYDHGIMKKRVDLH